MQREKKEVAQIQAKKILQNLTIEDRAKHYLGLLEFVRWLIQMKDEVKNLRELATFEGRTKEFEESIIGKVNTCSLSGTQADRKRGNRMWWIAMDEIQSAASSMASRIVMRKHFADFVSAFLEESSSDGKSPAEIEQEIEKKSLEIEREIVEKLTQCLRVREP